MGIGAAQAFLLVQPESANELDLQTALDRYYENERWFTREQSA